MLGVVDTARKYQLAGAFRKKALFKRVTGLGLALLDEFADPPFEVGWHLHVALQAWVDGGQHPLLEIRLQAQLL